MEKRYKYVLYSLSLALLLTIALFLIFYPSENSLGRFFGISIVYIYITYVCLYIGIFALILRFIPAIKMTNTFFYISIGTFNLLIGLLTTYLYFLEAANRQWLNKSLINLFIGFLILTDVLFFSSAAEQPDSSSQNK